VVVTPSRHVETEIVQGRRLGRRPHDPNRRVLKLSQILTGVTPAHPATVDHFGLIPPSRWGMLGNNQYGDCGPADVVHDRMLVAKYLANADVFPSTSDTLDLYKRSGNPNFPADDNGVVMADMLSEVNKVGVGPAGGRTRCVAYAQVNVSDLDEVHAAIAIFGSLSVGADLQVAQQRQTDAGGPWDYSPSAEWGGHAFLVGKYTSDTTAGRPDLSAISWGAPIGITDKFWVQQVQEAWVIIWPEHLANRSFLDGVDQKALALDYKALTGRDLPVTPAPTPTPTSGAITAAQNSANLQLAVTARAYLRYPHSGINDQMAQALKPWLQAWGL
jgi:hypothetical protein